MCSEDSSKPEDTMDLMGMSWNSLENLEFPLTNQEKPDRVTLEQEMGKCIRFIYMIIQPCCQFTLYLLNFI